MPFPLLYSYSDGLEIAVVYQRTCYHPSQFRGEQVGLCKPFLVAGLSTFERRRARLTTFEILKRHTFVSDKAHLCNSRC